MITNAFQQNKSNESTITTRTNQTQSNKLTKLEHYFNLNQLFNNKHTAEQHNQLVHRGPNNKVAVPFCLDGSPSDR